MSLGYESKNYESKKKIDYFYFKTIIEYSIDFTRPLRYTFYIVAAVFVIGFSLLNCLEFFVFRKMKSSSTINHPLCGCESNVIQKKLPFRVQ